MVHFEYYKILTHLRTLRFYLLFILPVLLLSDIQITDQWIVDIIAFLMEMTVQVSASHVTHLLYSRNTKHEQLSYINRYMKA